MEKRENGRIEGVISIETKEKNDASYHTKCDIRMDISNLTKEAMDVMRDKAEDAKSYELNISDRYECDKPGMNSLCFPDEPIRPGAEWGGEEYFGFGDLATVNEPTLKISYRLIKAVENKDGRYCVMECKPLTT